MTPETIPDATGHSSEHFERIHGIQFPQTKVVLYENGSKRSEEKPAYHLIPRSFLEATAKAFSEGKRYDEDSPNWRRGGPRFALAAYDHLIEHLHRWLDGDATEDHLGHAGAGLAMLCEFQARGVFVPKHPELPK